MTVKYEIPKGWIFYDMKEVVGPLTEAKARVMALISMPYQREWIEELQEIQLKREVAGTSRIEGADFTDRELDEALKETSEQLLTRSQKQAHAAVQTYRWIAKLPEDRPIDGILICEVHRRIVTGADDDHCPPGELRQNDQNVVFGIPRHRGAEGGEECKGAFKGLMEAVRGPFQGHDLLIQALALHYHFAAMHPFLDGNGRTARAVEALMLQRAGLRDSLFIAMSNYYYDEKNAYLDTLAKVRKQDHDLTPFLLFGLKGIAVQCDRLFSEIRINLSKALYRNTMYDLFNRLKSDRKRVLVKRQVEILKLLLKEDSLEIDQLITTNLPLYKSLRNPGKALIRDLQQLLNLKAISVRKGKDGKGSVIALRPEWPTEITGTTFFERVKKFPKAKTYSIFQDA